ncbi:MAG: NADH:ubiquinone reductase (Na(+)-transporting) subunit D [Candidatus Coatesbacteria bacterium RBG_13_66_14]|uniref:NADH:ubiquinone reductase (Na(+)-transporting) subunit D n=1 Tax=Candidatus Coatesbacteria bacterium RBG_13_66_14 TaxID=1817816 RepID=A0A1F5FH72_9BACT|nr:MAG: NADH:ubiquinone reductase (Na(+)-transporting) subunit D [Candidatus Coatesbacteria bacterium RBG_13_66_14]
MPKRGENWRIFVKGLWEDNPIFRMILGICSTLAVTNQVINTVAMGFAVVFVTVCSSFLVSLVRNVTGKRIRMAVYTLIIAAFVIMVDIALKSFVPTVSKAIGPYVGLIITNCIIMGRAEAFASNNKPLPSILDAAGVSLGYAMSLLIISVFRELLGFGTLAGIPVLGPGFEPWVIMVMAPGAFFMLGTYIWIIRTVQDSAKKRKELRAQAA